MERMTIVLAKTSTSFRQEVAFEDSERGTTCAIVYQMPRRVIVTLIRHFGVDDATENTDAAEDTRARVERKSSER